MLLALFLTPNFQKQICELIIGESIPI